METVSRTDRLPTVSLLSKLPLRASAIERCAVHVHRRARGAKTTPPSVGSSDSVSCAQGVAASPPEPGSTGWERSSRCSVFRSSGRWRDGSPAQNRSVRPRRGPAGRAARENRRTRSSCSGARAQPVPHGSFGDAPPPERGSRIARWGRRGGQGIAGGGRTAARRGPAHEPSSRDKRPGTEPAGRGRRPPWRRGWGWGVSSTPRRWFRHGKPRPEGCRELRLERWPTPGRWPLLGRAGDDAL